MASSHHNPFPGLKLRRLEIENYKRLDSLTVDFPRPRMVGDPDVMILGSENGGGKTSVLECVGLLFLAIWSGGRLFDGAVEDGRFAQYAKVLIQSGKEECRISGFFEVEEQEHRIDCILNRGLSGRGTRGVDTLRKLLDAQRRYSSSLRDSYMESLFGFTGEPLICPPLLHFNSFRKVQEENPSLAAMVEHPFGAHGRKAGAARNRDRDTSPTSAFKLDMLSALLGQKNVFEGMSSEDSSAKLELLNSLLERYAGGSIEKLRPLHGDTFEFLVTTKDGASFTFDGLSSGQKEVVSTLYLIWRHSQGAPCIVLIDEPELHLNAEWHADFVQQLQTYGPNNQYILATHSEQIFGCVDEERRALLVPDSELARV